MPIETTRRGFLLLVGTLLAAGAVRAAPPVVQTKLQKEPSRFGYLIYKDGAEFARFVEGNIPDDFEFEIQNDTELFGVSFQGREPAQRMIQRTLRYLRFNGTTYVPRDMIYHYDEEANIDWLEIGHIEPFNPDTDTLHWTIGDSEPHIRRNVYSAS